jgi:hypothetical protein
MLRTVWRVRTHEVLEQGILIVHRTAPRCGQAPYSRTSVTIRLLGPTRWSIVWLVGLTRQSALQTFCRGARK